MSIVWVCQEVNRMAVICSTLILLFPGNVAAEEDHGETEVHYNCGIMSLYTLLKIEKSPVEMSNIESCLPPSFPDGYSLKELRDAARACGVELTGVKLSSSMGLLDRPALVFMDTGSHGHYLVIRPCGHTGRLLQVLDANLPPAVIDESIFKSSDAWTGIALIPYRRNKQLLFLVSVAIFIIICLAAVYKANSYRRGSAQMV